MQSVENPYGWLSGREARHIGTLERASKEQYSAIQFIWNTIQFIWNTIQFIWNTTLSFINNMEHYSAVLVHIDECPYMTIEAGNMVPFATSYFFKLTNPVYTSHVFYKPHRNFMDSHFSFGLL